MKLMLRLTDSEHWRAFWNATDYAAAFMTGVGVGAGSSMTFHFASYLLGRMTALWLLEKQDRDLQALYDQLESLTRHEP